MFYVLTVFSGISTSLVFNGFCLKGIVNVFIFIGVVYFGITVFILFCVLLLCLSSLLDKVKTG